MQIALRELMERARETGASKDPIIRQRFAQLYAEAQVLRLNAYRGLTKLQAHGAPGPEGSLGKWHWAEVNQSLSALALDLAGPARAARRRPVDLPLPARARQLDRGRDDRDPQEHRRRARARAAAGEVNFDLTDDQQDIKRTAREFLGARYKLEEVRRLALEEERGFTDAQWDEIVQLGWPELAVRESGFGVVELAVVAEELGYACAPTPLSSTWAAALLLDAAGEAGRLADGRRGTVAQWDEDTDGDPERSSLGDDLRGVKIAVPDAAAADLIVVTVDGGRHFVVDAGDVEIEPVETLDTTRRHGDGAARRACGERSSPATTTRSPAPGTRSRS